MDSIRQGIKADTKLGESGAAPWDASGKPIGKPIGKPLSSTSGLDAKLSVGLTGGSALEVTKKAIDDCAGVGKCFFNAI